MFRLYFISAILLLLSHIAIAQIGLCNNDTLFVESAAVMFVEGDFINDHDAFVNNGEFTLQGNLKNNIELTEEGKGTFRLTGENTQIVDLSGEFKTFNLDIENDENVVFRGNRNLSVFGDLDFIDGIFYTQDENLIAFKEGSVYFDASDFSHIDGPAIKEGSTDFRFPIGKFGRLRPLGITAAPASNIYQAEYFRETAPSLDREEDLSTISDYEYWSFDGGLEVQRPKITLTWDETSFLNVPEEDLEIGYKPGLHPWQLTEASTMLPEQFETDLTSNQAAPGFGLYTFASTNGSTAMEDGVLDFQIEKHACTVHILWEANERSQRVFSYTVQRSLDGVDYEDLATLDARNSSNTEDYLFVDRDTEQQQVYHYRIQVTYFDETNALTDSKFITASCYPIALSLYPSPVYTDDILTLEVYSEIEYDLTIHVVGVLGRILQTRVLEIKPGNAKYIIEDTQHYGAAEYFIWTPEIEEIPTLKFQIIR